jgi:hypothetical protein
VLSFVVFVLALVRFYFLNFSSEAIYKPRIIRRDIIDSGRFSQMLTKTQCSQINQTNSISSEIQARILSGNRCYYAYGKLMKSRALNRSSKLKIYKSLIRPVVPYGCEAWTLTNRDEQHLRIFERRILRKIFGPV